MTVEAIRHDPYVAMFYRSSSVPMLQFSGRARIVSDPRERVFSVAHERERQQDPDRKGVAVVIDLDRVNGVLGFNSDGPIWCLTERSPTP